jgi:hypothetical protein
VCTKVLELPGDKLSHIINDNVVGNAKPIHDLFDKFNCLCCCDGGGRLRFNTFCELSTAMKMCLNPPTLSMIMLLGTPNLYKISLMNSTAFAAVMEAAGFALTHFVNYRLQ